MSRPLCASSIFSLLLLAAAALGAAPAPDRATTGADKSAPTRGELPTPLDLERLEARWQLLLEQRAPDAEIRKLDEALPYAYRHLQDKRAPEQAFERLEALRTAVRRHLSPPPPAPPAQPNLLPPKARPPAEAQVAPIPLNGADDCIDAPLIDFGTYLGSTLGQSDDGSPSCSLSSPAPDVWYRVTPPPGQPLFVTTRGSSFETVLSLHSACPTPEDAAQLECADTGPFQDDPAAGLAHDPQGGDVWIKITGKGSAAGDFQLQIAPGGRIAGRIVDENGDGLEQAEVTINVPVNSARATTDADGHFLSPWLWDRTYRLAAFSRDDYLRTVYDGRPCLNQGQSCLIEEGDAIEVTFGQVTDIGAIALPLGGVIEGTVTDRDTGLPPSDGSLSIDALDGSFSGFGRIQPDGSYRISGLRGGGYRVQFESFGQEYLPQAWPDMDCESYCAPDLGDPVIVEARRTAANIDFRVSRRGGIFGQVRDTVGTPLPSRRVELWEPGSERPLRTTFTDAEGRYGFVPSSPGQFFVTAGGTPPFVRELYPEVPCLASAEAPCDQAAGTVVESRLTEDVRNIDFTLSRGGRIRGRVVDSVSGEPLADVQVSVFTLDGQQLTGISTDADGRYLIEGLAGEYFLRANPQGAASPTHVPVVYPNLPCLGRCDFAGASPVEVPFEQEIGGVDFEVPRTSSFSGQVVSASTGEPVRADLRLSGEASSPFASTDDEGRFTIRHLQPGEYRLEVETFSFLDQERTVVIEVGQDVSGYLIELLDGGRVTGTLRTRDGQNAFSPVELVSVDGGSDGGRFLAGYEIHAVPPGRYVAVVSPFFSYARQIWPGINCASDRLDECPPGEIIEVGEGQTVTGIDFVLDALGIIRGRIYDRDTGAPVHEGSVQIFDTEGRFVTRATLSGDDSVSTFEIDDLHPGTYFLVYRGENSYADQVFGGLACSGEGCVATSGTALGIDYNREIEGIELAVSRGGRLTGRLTSPLLLDLGGDFEVDVLSPAGELIESIRPTSRDAWISRLLAPGPYRLVARSIFDGFFDRVWQGPSCHGSSCDPAAGGLATVVSGADTVGVDFSMDLAHPLTGTVFSAQTGEPVFLATVERRAADGEVLDRRTTGSDGRFRFFGFFEGTRLAVVPSARFQGQVWPEVACPPDGCDPVIEQGQVAVPVPGVPSPDYDFRLEPAEPIEPCGEETELCALRERFRLTARWDTGASQGEAGAVAITDESGYFWFFGPDNVEVVVKVLDGCVGFGHYWVFAAGLTNVAVELTAIDTWTGEQKTYVHPGGTLFSPLFDTMAFATCDAEPPPGSGQPAAPAPQPIAAQPDVLTERPEKTCQPSSLVACLNDDRFEVSARFATTTFQGDARAVRLTDDTAYFWFFDPNNVEVVLKVLDACEAFDRFWVFGAGLTNIEVEVTVRNLETGQVWTATNPQGANFVPIADTSSLSCP